MARALEMPLYHVMYDGDKPPQGQDAAHENAWGSYGKDARYMHKLCGFLSRMSARDRSLLLGFAENITKRKKSRLE
jgi:hypothetical protein